MRTIVIILFVCLFGLLAFIFLNVSEMSDRDRLQQSTIDGLKKQLKTQSDSLQNVLSVTRDSLEISYATIRLANKERIEAHERSQKAIVNLQKIIFIQHTDSSRNKAVKDLYPTFKPL